MRRFVVLMLFLSNTILFAAGSADLLTAIRNGDYAQVRKLIDSGADVNTTDKDGTTALMHSVIESDVRMMKLLIDKGANVNMKNSGFHGIDVRRHQFSKNASVAGCGR